MCLSSIWDVLGHISSPKCSPPLHSILPKPVSSNTESQSYSCPYPFKGLLLSSPSGHLPAPAAQNKEQRDFPLWSFKRARTQMDGQPLISPYGSRPLGKEKRVIPYIRSLPLPPGKLTASQAKKKSPHGSLFQLTKQTQKGIKLSRYLGTLPSCGEHTQRSPSTLKTRRGDVGVLHKRETHHLWSNLQALPSKWGFAPVLLISGKLK